MLLAIMSVNYILSTIVSFEMNAHGGLIAMYIKVLVLYMVLHTVSMLLKTSPVPIMSTKGAVIW